MATRACVILAVALAASVAGATPPRDSLEPDPERSMAPTTTESPSRSTTVVPVGFDDLLPLDDCRVNDWLLLSTH